MSGQSNSFNKGAGDYEKLGDFSKDKYYNTRIDHIRDTNSELKSDIRSLREDIKRLTTDIHTIRAEINKTTSVLETSVGKIDTRLANVENEKISRWDAAMVSGSMLGGAIALIAAIAKLSKGI